MPYLTQLADVARRTGYPVTEVSGWKSRGHGPQPEVDGIVCHHTAGWNDMHVVRDGRPGLDGPLSQIWLRKDGRIFIVAAGRCWHNAPSTSLGHTNSHSIGIEAENDGRAPWPPAQLNAYQKLCAELCKAFRLPASAVKGHKEVNRSKPDPHSINMNSFRATVARLITGEEDDVPEILSLGANIDQPVAAGETVVVDWQQEWTDTGGDHATGSPHLAVEADYWAVCDALVKLRGFTPGEQVDIAWSRLSRDGKALQDDAWRLTYSADLNGRVEASVGGQFSLGATVLGCLRVINERPYPVTIERVTMAKLALFKR